MNRVPRIPLLLYSYLSAEILAPFFASFLIMNSVFFLVRLIPFLNVVLELNIGFTDFVRLFSYIFPNMFLYSMPMASMVAMIIAFSRLSVDTEILAMKASGISIYTILPPVVLISLLLAVITGYFSITLIPSGEIAMKQLMFQLAREKIDKGIKENAFTEALGDVVVNVQSIDQSTGVWHHVWVSDMRGQIVPTITMAQKGSMVSDIRGMRVKIVLEDGSINRTDGKYAQNVSFDRYQINIPLHIPSVIGGKDVARQSFGSMTMEQLRQAALQSGSDTEKGREALVHYHKRMVLSAGCFILSLLGLPLGLLARPGRSAIGIPLGLGFFILYYILFTVGKNITETTSVPPVVAMWFPNLFFLVLTLILLHRTANEKPLMPAVLINAGTALMRTCLLPLIATLRHIPGFPSQPEPEKSMADARMYDRAREEIPGPGHLTKGTIHADPHTMNCHIPGCTSYNCLDCTIEFKNLEIAEQAGFTLCATCLAILEKRGRLQDNSKDNASQPVMTE